MSRWRGFLSRLSETADRGRARRELEEEMRFHIERDVERLLASGHDPETARAEAERRFGSVGRARESAREDLGLRWVEQGIRDARHAARGLRRSPGFAVTAILTLGLGIGATTAIYSVVDAVVVRPLPYPEADRLVRMYEQNTPDNRFNISVADYEAVVDRQRSFEDVAALRVGETAYTGGDRPERIAAGWVTAGWFRLLGVQPAEGRGFLPDEDRPDAPATVVLSAGFRERAFGDAPAVGRTVTLDGIPHTVVGVLPPGRATLAGHEADVWPILQLAPPTRRGPFILRGFGRLRPDVTVEAARRDLDEISRAIYPIWADGFRDANARIAPVPLKTVVVGDAGRAVWLLFAAVGGVLLIAVANVANLWLVRASGREREMGLRASLGASRARLARQLLVEGLVLATAGGLMGVAIASLGIRAVVLLGRSLPRVHEISLDPGALGFATAVTLGVGILFGLAPLLAVYAPDLARTVRGGAGGADRPGLSRLRSALVTAEFALALPLLAGAGLLVGSFARLQSVDPGFEPEGLLSARVSLPGTPYAGYEEIVAFWDEALRRLEAVPGVTAAGISTSVPPNGGGNTNNFDLRDRPVPEGTSEPAVPWSWATPGFFDALGVRAREGRTFEMRDRDDDRAVVLVSRSWAERFYPGEEVLGRELHAGGDRSTPMTVIGVVDDVKLAGLAGASDAAVYEPFDQAGFRRVFLLVRGDGPVAGLLPSVENVFRTLDPELPLSDIRSMTDLLSASVAGPRSWTVLFGTFAVLALALAAIGVYGVLSCYVARQRRDIGIRLALGARPARVRRLVLRRGLGRAGLGIGIGLVATVWATRWVEGLLFGVSRTDVRILGAASALLIGVALLACWIPANRATRVDPIGTLRAD